MTTDDLMKLCQELDLIEANMRQLEAKVTRIGMRFREQVPRQLRSNCGFVEGEDDGLRPMPRESQPSPQAAQS